jgi:hypothetical protein
MENPNPYPNPKTISRTVSIFVRDLVAGVYERLTALNARIENAESKIEELELQIEELRNGQ